MTWEDLCVKAKEMGYVCWKDTPCLESDDIQFFKNGTVYMYIYVEDVSYNRHYPIAYGRTPEQMYQIMEALR